MLQQAAVKHLLKSLFLLVTLLTIGSGLAVDLVKKQGSFFAGNVFPKSLPNSSDIFGKGRVGNFRLFLVQTLHQINLKNVGESLSSFFLPYPFTLCNHIEEGLREKHANGSFVGLGPLPPPPLARIGKRLPATQGEKKE
jgi:hypothetical protein